MKLTDTLNPDQHPRDLLPEVLSALSAMNLGWDFAIQPEIDSENVRILVSRSDDDLNEPLGAPACNLGETYESCQ
jgi:hypothetical protein